MNYGKSQIKYKKLFIHIQEEILQTQMSESIETGSASNGAGKERWW